MKSATTIALSADHDHHKRRPSWLKSRTISNFLLVAIVGWTFILQIESLGGGVEAASSVGGTGSQGRDDNQLESIGNENTRNSDALASIRQQQNSHHHRMIKERRHCVLVDDKGKGPGGSDSELDFTLPESAIDSFENEEDEEPAITEMVCAQESQFCYAFWQYRNGSKEFLKQGCWEASSKTACINSQCVAEVPRPKQFSETTISPINGISGQQDLSGSNSFSNNGGEQPQLLPSQQTQQFFCCCDGEYCNMDVEVLYVEEIADSDEDQQGLSNPNYNPTGRRSLPIIMICTGSIFCGLLIMFAGYRYWKRMSLRYNKNGGRGEAGDRDGGEDGLSQGGIHEGKLLLLDGEEDSMDERNIIDGIQLVVLLARGKFASVYEGKIPSLSDAPYALKCFTKDQKEFFENERFVFNYLGKHCNHENIIKYYGWQDFTVGPTTHLILVMDKICPGSLREYLQSVTGAGDTQEEGENENESVLKVMNVLRICSGIASGLSYLHGENRDEIVIAHRDLTSKNILLDGETLTPKITDFGLSLVTKGSKYYWAGRERQAEFCSLSEAGTLRYMAPELLEGAVNLKDCENALKQADVYALALIIWEVAHCSRDIRLTKAPQPAQQQHQQNNGDNNGIQDETGNNSSNNAILPVQHCLPYEEEIGKDNFSMDLLTRHVVQYRNRPNFRRWRDSPYTRQLRDTLIESWDAEPDARLTALCIVERLLDIRNIRVKNSDLPGSLGVTNQQQIQTPLESPGQNGLMDAVIDSPWTGRNPCLQRNLLTVTASSTSGGGGGMGMMGMGMSTSGSGMSESNSLLEGHHHPLLLNHYDFAKNQANLNFYHNYVGGSSGGASYSSTSTTSASTGIGGNNTEMSNVSSVTDERINHHHNPSSSHLETRFQNTGGPVGGGAQSPNGIQQGAQNVSGGPPPLPPTIPFVQNLHA